MDFPAGAGEGETHAPQGPVFPKKLLCFSLESMRVIFSGENEAT